MVFTVDAKVMEAGIVPVVTKFKNMEVTVAVRIFVDADACPVVSQVESVASWHGVPVTLLCDTNHVLTSDYSEIVVIGAGADAVDFALINRCQNGDVVVTQDYGVAAMALARGAYAIHQDGWQYTESNIDDLLAKRHRMQKIRCALHKHHIKGGKKRTAQDDENFVECLDALLDKCMVDDRGHYE